jgi:hypothetical protein
VYSVLGALVGTFSDWQKMVSLDLGKEKLNRQIQKQSIGMPQILLVLVGPHVAADLGGLVSAHVLNDDFPLVLIRLQEVDSLIETTAA